MFEDSLLESSAKMAPVLKGKHWLISIVIGAAVFLAGYFATAHGLGQRDQA